MKEKEKEKGKKSGCLRGVVVVVVVVVVVDGYGNNLDYIKVGVILSHNICGRFHIL